MRACEGCRRRKIKCDAATTNAWPCAACVRLKLHCVPPTVNYNRTHVTGGHISGLERVLDFDNSSGGSGDEDYTQSSGVPDMYQMVTGAELMGTSQPAYTNSFGAYSHPAYSDKPDSQQTMAYDNIPSMQLPDPSVTLHRQTSYQVPSVHPIPLGDNVEWSREIQSTNLTEALGELKIDETGIGMSNRIGCTKTLLTFQSSLYLETEKDFGWRSSF